MKILCTKKARRRAIGLMGLIFAILLALNVGGYIGGVRPISIFAAISDAQRFEVKSRLLQEAVAEVGACNPDKAVNIWASGLGNRSAALQYAVMSPSLQQVYASQLETTFPNWVTGVSSPWVSGYTVTRKEQLNAYQYRYSLRFHTTTSTGPAGNYEAVLTITKQGDYWRITEIQADEGLFPYTGFREKIFHENIFS